MGPILPVILCGGRAQRLWPLVDDETPKTLLSLQGRSLLAHTVRRVADRSRYAPPVLITAAAHADAITQELTAIGAAELPVLVEPAARDTAAAVLSAALFIREREPEATVLILPADHAITEEAAFHTAVQQAVSTAAAGYLVCFGIPPSAPQTDYGYIRPGPPCGAYARSVAAFTEKPDAAVAASWLAEGCLWNSGMFVFPLSTLIEEAETHAVALLAACEQAVAHRRCAGRATVLGEALRQAPRQPIDRAIMERTARAAVVPAALGWSDIGTYSGLWQISPKDSAGNACTGRVTAHEAQRNLIYAPQHETVLLGVEDVVVVQRHDRLLIARRDRLEALKALLEREETAPETTPVTGGCG